MRRAGSWIATLVAVLRCARADAEPPTPVAPANAVPPPTTSHDAASDRRTGRDMLRRLPLALVLDGMWSVATDIDTELTNRSWGTPHLLGFTGHYATRILYGTTWSVMLGAEAVAVVAGSGASFEWIDAATYRVDWALPLDAPTCSHPGASGGCGIGVGTFSYLQLRPRRTGLWFEAGGGWIQQRILNDELRTVAESSWVLTPVTVLRELSTPADEPVALRVRAGAGVFFGMHNAHMHPTLRGEDVYRHRPWSEIYPLDGGLGPGARLEGRLTLFGHLAFDGDLVVAPLVAGGPVGSVSHAVAPLDFARDGMSVWRKVDAGLGWVDRKRLPFDLTVAVFAAELSDRPITRVGYCGGMLRFDIPLRLSRED